MAATFCNGCKQPLQQPNQLTRYQVRQHLESAARIERYKLGAKDLTAALDIAYQESRYVRRAQNPRSTAFGLYQFLDRTWYSVGIHKTSCATCQSRAFIRYVDARYKTPSRAWNFRKKRNFY